MAIWELLSGIGIGAFFTKVGEVFYEEYKEKRSKRYEAERVIQRNLDPILKSANAVVSKLFHIIQDDFHSIIMLNNDKSDLKIPQNAQEINTLYLLASFWARLEIFKKESLYVDISKNEAGQKLRAFIHCLESKKVKILSKSLQMGIADILIINESGNHDCISFYKFSDLMLNDENAKKWISPMKEILLGVKNKKNRQKLIKYYMILHILIDTLDPEHLTTNKERPILNNKLSKQSNTDLKFRILKEYLPFVEKPWSYTRKKS